MNTEEVLKKFGNETVDIIRKNMSTAKQNATGSTSRNIVSESSEDRVIVSGPKHIFTLETGRGPYDGGPASNLKSKIEQWMKAKGVQPRIGQTLQESARDIAWFINKEGSKLFREGGRKDIITPALSDSRINQLTEDISDVKSDKVLNVIEIGITR